MDSLLIIGGFLLTLAMLGLAFAVTYIMFTRRKIALPIVMISLFCQAFYFTINMI